ncbi:hypothetical protein AKJ62_03920 [candidate division MSBL1 archaeon SCGC-AAA259D14]|uniref:Uncharacterized protein n=1 Tax=candidate division MSBL1 archaeon SCGC-AAA259D14 TaxID=1698261 RepID=A0A133U4F5_9EURY|nr:hypothetical protein AKJ62_03920 [candidate division MSBL1 archaeon SCGC-AAA259D14]
MTEGEGQTRRGSTRRREPRGISNMVAGLIIVSATLVAGTVTYMVFLQKADIRVGAAEIRVEKLSVIHAGGETIASTTLKNTGDIVLENVKVEIVCSEENRAVLTVDNLAPDHTGGDFKTGNWGFRTGETYPVAVTARFENKVVISKGLKVTVR